MVKLCRIDMVTEGNMMASHMTVPREGHIECPLHIFTYLNIEHNSRIVFDPTYPEIGMTQFKEYNWKHFYLND